MEILVAFASGLLALLGGFAGAALTRRTEYERWLRQERGAVFARFLQALQETRTSALNLVHYAGESEEERASADLKVTELFSALLSQAGIVRLYLGPTDREPFSQAVHELYLVHSITTRQSHRMERVAALSRELQDMFEASLHG